MLCWLKDFIISIQIIYLNYNLQQPYNQLETFTICQSTSVCYELHERMWITKPPWICPHIQFSLRVEKKSKLDVSFLKVKSPLGSHVVWSLIFSSLINTKLTPPNNLKKQLTAIIWLLYCASKARKHWVRLHQKHIWTKDIASFLYYFKLVDLQQDQKTTA